MSFYKLWSKNSRAIKLFFIYLSFTLFSLQSTAVFAESAELKEEILLLQAHQSQIDNKLQQFSLVGNTVIADNKALLEKVEWFTWVTFILALMILGVIGLVVTFYKKYNAALLELQKKVKSEGESKQYQNNQIANLQQFISDQRDQLKLFDKGLGEKNQKIEKELLQLKSQFVQYQSQENIAEDKLEALFNHPVSYLLSSSEKEQLHQLINDNALSFSSNLKARALEEEYSQAWQRAIDYWETYLTDQGHDIEALVHIGYANYQLAIENSKDDYYINQSMQAFEKIMLAAPDYFDDMQGYDGEESLNEANDFNENSKEYNLYQQLELYLMKLDELRNYQSIYMLACNYANDGKVTDAENCLKQIPIVFHSSHCKQLQKDSNLAVLRQFDWFNDLVEEAC